MSNDIGRVFAVFTVHDATLWLGSRLSLHQWPVPLLLIECHRQEGYNDREPVEVVG